MAESEEKAQEKSFWTTMPGILTGVAAVITALGGLVVTLGDTGLLRGGADAVTEAAGEAGGGPGAGGETGPGGGGEGADAVPDGSDGSGAPAGEAVTEREPNADYEQATSIPVDRPVRAYLADGGDVDMFVFRTGDGFRNVFEIRVTNRGGFAPDVMLFDGLKNRIANEYAITVGADVVIPLSAQPSSTYYIRVSDLDGFAGRAGDYTLTVGAN